MREILFRAKSNATQKWVDGFYEPNPFVPGNHLIIDSSGDAYQVDPTTIGQYTGLTDRNGTKIFEGDIINAEWSGEKTAQVVFLNGMFKAHGMSLITWVADPCDGCRVIGNIYDKEASGNG